MPLFYYTALDQAGRRSSGTIDAPRKELALEKLREENLVPLAVEPVREPSTVEDFLQRFRGIPAENLVYFFRQLSTMIAAGISPMRALSTLEEQEENKRFRETLGELIARIESGTSLHVALAEHPAVFNRLMISMVRAGEQSGSLAESLLALSEQLEKGETLRRAIRSALVYPKVLLSISFVIVSGILIFIVPRFIEIFENLTAGRDVSLPIPTQILVSFSNLIYPLGEKNALWFLSVFGRFIVLGLLIFAATRLLRYLLEQPGPRAAWDGWKMRAPMRIGTIVQKVTIARFARTFSSLLASGVPAVEAMDIVADTSGNVIVASAVMRARERMLAGAPIAETLQESGVFPLTVTRMIEVGEETGRLEEMLNKIADFYEEESALAIKGLTSIVEPLMVLFVGGIIGAIIVAIYLPLFSIYNEIGASSGALFFWQALRRTDAR